MNYAFYVSGKGGRFKEILNQKLQVIKQTKLIITDSDQALYLKSETDKKNINFVFFDYELERKESNDVNKELSGFILDQFLKYGIDYCFCFGDHILKGELLEVYKNKIINFHPSLLPLFPGRNAIDQALAAPNTILLGNTAHFIDEGTDTGPIIMQNIISKNAFKNLGYDGVLNFQVPMLELIYNSLEKQELTIANGEVSFKTSPYNLNSTFFT